MKLGARLQSFLSRHELGICGLLAGTLFFAFIVLLPLLVDPAVLSFVLYLEPASCLTVYGAHHVGTSKCSWTSCQEGCTVDIYSCWQINVTYSFRDKHLERSNSVPYDTGWPEARLFPNVVGCGYPPHVDCKGFFNDYGSHSGQWYPCYVSTSDPAVAVIQVDLHEATVRIILGFIPLLAFFVLLVYMALRLRCKRRKKLQMAKAAHLVKTILEEEERRAVASARSSLERRKQSWINSFREDILSASRSQLNLNLQRSLSSSKTHKLASAPKATSPVPAPITSVSATVAETPFSAQCT